jgi:hypothetical protein
MCRVFGATQRRFDQHKAGRHEHEAGEQPPHIVDRV